MTTRAEAVAAAAVPLAHGYRIMLGLDGTSVAEAARLAYTPGGPTLPEIEARITRRRVAAGLMADPTAHQVAS